MPYFTEAKQAAYELKAEERRPRAMMAIHHNDHIVIDSLTGKRYPLPAVEAWQKYEELNHEG